MIDVVAGTRDAYAFAPAGAPRNGLVLNDVMAKDADRPAVDDEIESETESEQDAPSAGDDAQAGEDERAEVVAAAADDGDADRTTSADTDARANKGGKRWISRLWWALPILMVVEFYAYGHNGRLQICVGKQGHTDFSLVGQERTDENRWSFPRCETRLNLGLRSEHDEKVAEGLAVACRGATIFRHQGESKACVAGEQGWEHRVEGSFVPPWDPAYYEHLFWFLQ